MIAAIMPCRGRAEQTVANIQRLLATAGDTRWRLWCVIDDDPHVYDLIGAFGTGRLQMCVLPMGKHGYWHALTHATEATDAELLVNLANDLLPGPRWLERGLAAYRERFGDGHGLMGFNGDGHGPEHSCHFIIHRQLLKRYGGWPVWYRHNFGDTELCTRAQQDGCYAKAPWALLYHDHPIAGKASDEVYAAGMADWNRDQQLFRERWRAGWPKQS